jgi:hypothetical protein
MKSKMKNVIISKKAKVISCFGNIKRNKDISVLCNCSNAYVSQLWIDFSSL